MNYHKSLLSKIYNKKAKVAIIGLGYVGIPLSKFLSNLGFQIIGIDNDIKKINALKNLKAIFLIFLIKKLGIYNS